MTAPTFLQVLDQAADLFAQLGPDLPELTWSIHPGEVRGQADADAGAYEVHRTLVVWANRLGLKLDPEACLPGMHEYAATIAGCWRLVVWGITDRTVWEARTALEAGCCLAEDATEITDALVSAGVFRDERVRDETSR
jgi:hypothetical protein